MKYAKTFVEYYRNKNGIYMSRLSLFSYYPAWCHLKRKHDLLQEEYFYILERYKNIRKMNRELQTEIDRAVVKAEPELHKYFSDALN